MEQEKSPILDRNISVVRDRYPMLADTLEAQAQRGNVGHESVTGSLSDADTVRGALEEQTVLALHGIGDGSMFRVLADRPIGLNGKRTAIYIVEPDTDRLLSLLASIDLSGPVGPLASTDVEWFIGPQWSEQLRDCFRHNLCLPIPSKIIQTGHPTEELSGMWRAIQDERVSMLETSRRQIDAWSDKRDIHESSMAMLGKGSRPARALVVSSRFTTVLCHNATEIVDALCRLGWHAELLIEEDDHLRLNEAAVSQVLSNVRPDVVFTINHHRNSLPGVPATVPFVCWVQDDPPHLISPEASRGIGPFDFYAGIWMHRYVQQWAYPKSACIAMPRLTAMRDSPGVRADFARPVVSYVSNAGVDPRGVVADFAQHLEPVPMSRVFLEVCNELLTRYENGESVAMSSTIAGMLTDQAGSMGVTQIPKETFDGLSELIQLHLNNPLYRQQGLGWAEQASDELGVQLAIYGAHWESHPRFAKFAKGAVPYGDGLAAVMRTSAINLRLEPYPPTSHQRLLDVIAAGGVILSRSLGKWHEPENQFVRQFYTCGADQNQDAAEVRRELSPESFAHLSELAKPLAEHFGLSGTDAVIDRYLYRVREDLMMDYEHAPLPPSYFETVFDDPCTLRERIEGIVSDPKYHERLRTEQGNFVRARYSYDNNIRLLMETVANRVISRVEEVGTVVT